jgi:hypothetical protein
VETTTPWVGGDNGTANIQARQLKERTEYLKERSDEVDEAKQGMPSLEARIEAIGSSPKALYKKDFVPDAPVAASTENVDIVTGGLLEIDGVQTAAGDLVFLKDQGDPVENGFWEVQTGAWNRYEGYTGGQTECFTQKLIDVNGGAENKGLIFVLEADAYIIGQTALNFRQTYLSSVKKPSTALFRNRTGRVEELENLSPAGYVLVDKNRARNLFDVFGVNYIDQLMEILLNKNNAGGKPDYSGLLYGDYIDGIDLSAIPAERGGTAGQVWNDTYKNNRIVISAFNPYKGVGDTEVTKNHIRFDFENVPLRGRMNASDTNTGGYPASEMRAFLDGANGDGTGDKSGVTTAAFLKALKTQIGDHILPIRRLLSKKGDWAWVTCSLWLPSEDEFFGESAWGESNYGDGQKLHIPLYRDSYQYRIKRYNGGRDWWWLNSPSSGSAAYFCYVYTNGAANYHNASAVGGCAPAFCVR